MRSHDLSDTPTDVFRPRWRAQHTFWQRPVKGHWHFSPQSIPKSVKLFWGSGPAAVTRCTDPGKIWRGTALHVISTVPYQVSSLSVKRWYDSPKNLKFDICIAYRWLSCRFCSDSVMLTKFWATVCKRVRAVLSDSCLSSLPVTLVYWGQTVGWIKMPHCARWWPSSPTEGAQQPPPTFRPISIVAKWSPISATAELVIFENTATEHGWHDFLL